MNENQRSALSDCVNSSNLARTLEPIVTVFLDHLQYEDRILSSDERTLIKNHETPAAQLYYLLDILKNKDGAWSALITYLKENHYGKLADQLQKSAGEIQSPSLPTSPDYYQPIYMRHYSSPYGTNYETCSTPAIPPISTPNTTSTSITLLQEFTLDVAKFYLSHYVRLLSLGEYHKHVKNAWVPLQIEENTKGAEQRDRFYHDQLLQRLATDVSDNVALIKADPGMGKTTLVMKIAYDWAIKILEREEKRTRKKRKNPRKQLISKLRNLLHKNQRFADSDGKSTVYDVDNFSLILALPLREAGRANNFLPLAVNYFLRRFENPPLDRDLLISEIFKLQSKLLLCFDGLDEYESYEESPFRSLFATPLDQQSVTEATGSSPPPFIQYKLIITSRPYACDHLSRGFLPLRFKICRIDDANLMDFVRLHCQVESGVFMAMKFLQNHHLVVKVPLILTFICHLADANQEIPAKMTSLYDRFLWEMWLREKRENRLAENDVDIHQWKKTKVILTTAALAYWGCQVGKFEFNRRKLTEFEVPKDSFTCGFLLYKFDFIQACQMAEFPHRSVQEFFAALHCCNLRSISGIDDIKWIITEICNKDSQFGPFLFGVFSQNQNLSELLDSLAPPNNNFGLSDMICDWSDLRRILSNFSDCLCDCHEMDIQLCSQWLAGLISRSYAYFTDLKRREILGLTNIPKMRDFCLSQISQEGLKLECLYKLPSACDWFLSEQQKTAKVAWITKQLTTEITERFDKIEVVLWLWDNGHIGVEMDWDNDILNGLYRFPPVTTMIVRTKEKCEREVNFFLDYDSSITADLRFLSFGGESWYIRQIQRKFKGRPHPDYLEITSHSEDDDIVWLKVKVYNAVMQEVLIKELILLAVFRFWPIISNLRVSEVSTNDNESERTIRRELDLEVCESFDITYSGDTDDTATATDRSIDQRSYTSQDDIVELRARTLVEYERASGLYESFEGEDNYQTSLRNDEDETTYSTIGDSAYLAQTGPKRRLCLLM